MLLDLDQTVIFGGGSVGQDGARVVEHIDGAAAAVMSVAAWEPLTALAEEHEVVPVTTRTLAQLARVRLPAAVRRAVCANGGRLVVDGVPDRRWAAWVAWRAGGAVPLPEAQAVLARAQGAWVRTVRTADDLFGYVVATDPNAIDATWLTTAQEWAEHAGWVLSRQGRKAYLVPGWLSKEAALQRLRRPGQRVLAAGDSLLDAGMLCAADLGVRPAHGELGRQPWLVPDVEVADGATALDRGEQVLRRLAQALA